MHLFIFNSRKFLALVFYFLMLFGFYNLFLYLVQPEVSEYQHQGQKNFVRAEDYLFDKTYEKVIVGTSMAFRMDTQLLRQQGVFNLAFAGDGVLTGLEIIKKSQKIPEVIYVETNLIFRELNSEFVEKSFAQFEMRKYLPALREKYQPINLVLTLMKNSLKKHIAIDDARNERAYQIAMEEKLKSYDKFDIQYKEPLARLEELLNYFASKKVRIVFFEMPIDERLENTYFVKKQKEIINQAFNFPYMFVVDNQAYLTADGVHLLPKSALEFTKFFIQHLD